MRPAESRCETTGLTTASSRSSPPAYVFHDPGIKDDMDFEVHYTDQQKKKLLPPIYSGEQRTWQLLTEPNAGSDVASVSTTAVRDGNEYVITGQKIFVGSAHGCEAMWTLCRTGPAEARHQNLSWFMIPFDLAGITTTPLQLMGSSDKNI